MRGYIDDVSLINSFLKLTSSLHLSCNQTQIAKAIIVNTTVQVFEATASKFTGDLQDRIFNAVLLNSGLDHNGKTSLYLDAIYAHPYTYVIGKYVEESSVRQMKQASDRDMFNLGNWDISHRVLIGVDCRKLLSSRNYIVKTKVNSILAKFLRETVETLAMYPY